MRGIKMSVGARFSCFFILLLGLSADLNAGGVIYVPIAATDITFFVPVQKIDCLPANICITWINLASSASPSSFTDDPEFNYSDDVNKIHRLSALYFNSPSSNPLQLQCVIDAQGHWDAVKSSTNDSSASVIYAKDGFGNPQNINYNATIWPAYQHTWPANLLVNATNCLAQYANLSAPKTYAWTYTHKQISYHLRAVNPDGSVAFILSPSVDNNNCRVNDTSLNLWQRTLNCAGSIRTTSFTIAVNETITRVTNLGTLSLQFNANPNDAWICAYHVSVDGVDDGVIYGDNSVLGSPHHPNFFSKQVTLGKHTVAFTNVPNCFATQQNSSGWCHTYGTCTGNTTTSTSSPYSINMTMESTPAQEVQLNVTY